MAPLERSLLWVLPAFALAVFMVFAMVEFTLSLLERRSRRARQPAGPSELRSALLALNDGQRPYRIVPGRDCDYVLEWDAVDASWLQIFAKVKLSISYRVRLLLDERAHELRVNELLRSYHWFIGFDGWRPVFNLRYAFQFQTGVLQVLWAGRAYGLSPGLPPRIGRFYEFSLNTMEAKEDLGEVVGRAGWRWRPVQFPFQATHAGLAWSRRLTPAFARGWSRRRFWGVVYPASYVASVAYLLWMVGGWPPTQPDVLGPVLLVSVAWWATWALLAWLLIVGFPGLNRRLRKRRR